MCAGICYKYEQTSVFSIIFRQSQSRHQYVASDTGVHAMGNSASTLPYTIGAPVPVLKGGGGGSSSSSSNNDGDIQDGWILHTGTTKSNGKPVSVFVAKKPSLCKTPVQRSKNPHLTQLAPAIQHFLYAKKLRHPHILQVYATLDTDHPNDGVVVGSDSSSGGAATNASTATTASMSLAAAVSSASSQTGDYIIVTEPVIPFDMWLREQQPSTIQLAWGMECVIRALHFLHSSATLSHGNVCPAALYVTPAGDVKISRFALCFNTNTDPSSNNSDSVPLHFRDYESLLTPDPYRSPERHQSAWNDIAAAPGVHGMDSYSVGVLLQYAFSLTGGTLPTTLVKAVQRLQTSNIRMRPKLQPLLKCPAFDTPYAHLNNATAEYHVMPMEQKIVYWQNLQNTLIQTTASVEIVKNASIPASTVLYKLLPLMKSSIDAIGNNEGLKAQAIYRRECKCLVT
jgi:SCY1-like protein 1